MKRDWLYRGAVLILAVVATYQATKASDVPPVAADVALVERLARENAEMRITFNRQIRARTGYAYPKMGEYDFQRITACARAVSWPAELLAAIRQTENGGRLLDLGIQSIPADIRENYPPSYWQYAAGQRIMVQVAGQMILNDPEIQGVFAHRLAARWKAKDQQGWVENFLDITRKNRSKEAKK